MIAPLTKEDINRLSEDHEWQCRFGDAATFGDWTPKLMAALPALLAAAKQVSELVGKNEALLEANDDLGSGIVRYHQRAEAAEREAARLGEQVRRLERELTESKAANSTLSDVLGDTMDALYSGNKDDAHE